MENLPFNSNKPLDTNNFVRIGDVSYFEGPLLSLFEELNSGHLYIFDWVDRDDTFNRWLIYRVAPKFLLQFIHGKISHLELFERRPDHDVYCTDIDSRNKLFSTYNAYAIESVPQKYYPNSDNFFEVLDCTHFEKIKSVVINSLSKQKSGNEYSFTSSMNVLKHKGKSAYFNPLNTEINSIAYPVTPIDSSDIPMPSNLLPNNTQDSSFTLYSTVKKQKLQNKKQYANQYN